MAHSPNVGVGHGGSLLQRSQIRKTPWFRQPNIVELLGSMTLAY
ncbi:MULTISPECIES: hypothetical protein [Pseudomonadaceae]|nr:MULTISPECIES: hypothetical protein [Pseudomonadaceae]